MSRKRALELCDEVDAVPDDMNAMAYHNRAISLLKMAIRELCKEFDALERDNSNLLKDLKALTQSEQRLQSEKCELARQLAEARSILARFVSEIDKDPTNMVRCTVGDLGVELEQEMRLQLAKERDDLAVKLAHAQEEFGVNKGIAEEIKRLRQELATAGSVRPAST